MMDWYPQNKVELDKLLRKFLDKGGDNKKAFKEEIHGLIVPHAGYVFSGEVAGKAFSLLKKRKTGTDTAVIFGPSHYIGFQGIRVLEKAETPLGEIKIMKNNFEKISYEHSVDNQIPFLQELGFKEILPLVIGELSEEDVKEIIEKILKINTIYVFSTDLSHFLTYEKATKLDKETIKIIRELDIENWEKIEACGKFPLLVMMNLCKVKNWKPKLVEYKNSGDVIGDKTSVVGYASFYF